MKILKNIDLKFCNKKPSSIFDIKVGGDISKLKWQKNKNSIYKYPIFSNSIQNNGLYGFSDKPEIYNESLTISARGTIGACFYRKGGFSAIGRLIVLIPNSNINVRFFYYLFKKTKVIGEDGAIKSLTVPMLDKTILNYPEFLTQQTKIANLLDKQESLINLYKQKLSILKQKEKYYQDKLLSGDIRIKLNQDSHNYAIEQGWVDNNGEVIAGQEDKFEDWLRNGFSNKIKFYKNKQLVKNFEKLSTIVSSIKTGKLNTNSKKENGKYPFFTCSRTTYRIDSYSFDQEAILIAGNGEVGESKYYKGKFDAYQRTYVLGDFKIHPQYLFYYINYFFKEYIQKESVGGVIKFIKINDIKNFPVFIPETNREIFLLYIFLSILKNQKDNLNRKIQLEEQKMDYLMDKLLSGKLQVVD